MSWTELSWALRRVKGFLAFFRVLSEWVRIERFKPKIYNYLKPGQIWPRLDPGQPSLLLPKPKPGLDPTKSPNLGNPNNLAQWAFFVIGIGFSIQGLEIAEAHFDFSLKQQHYSIKWTLLHILKIQPLNCTLFTFLIYMSNFMSIEYYLLYDL